MARMEGPSDDIQKRREIRFLIPHPDPVQAQSAARLVAEVEGVLGTEVDSPVCMRVVYDLRRVTLREIEEALDNLGYHLDNSLLSRVRRAIWYYAEDTQLANMGCERPSDCTRRIFVSHYQEREHGCRDDRPSYWRRYL